MAPVTDPNDSGKSRAVTTVGAGRVDSFRTEFTPTSSDQRFGIFQIHARGVPMGDGTTTALYPHYLDLHRLSAAVELAGAREQEPLHLGDTFDHLELYWQLTEASVVFTFTTRPESEWGVPPSWAPPAGEWIQASVARSDFISTWREAEPQFRRLLDRG